MFINESEFKKYCETLKSYSNKINNSQKFLEEITNTLNILNQKDDNMNKGTDIKGKKFNNYIAKEIVGKDKSRHNIWLCECPICKKTIKGTVYDLTRGRINLNCNCDDFIRGKRRLLPIYEDFNNYGDIKIAPLSKVNSKEFKLIKEDDKILPLTTTNNTQNNLNNYETAKNNCDSYYVTTGMKYKHIIFTEEQEELLDYPVYYQIAHCIPGDLTFYGDTAKRIDYFYNMKQKAEDMVDVDIPEPGEILWINNVFNIILTHRKFEKATYDNLRISVKNLVQYCFNENVTYLAMPRIGSGRMGLDWSKVYKIIEEAFVEVYEDEKKNSQGHCIEVHFCYK